MEAQRGLGLLGAFTAEQWGMVTSRQAGGVGVDGVTLHRLEKTGHLDRVRRGVYAATTAVRSGAREEQAAWLALDPGTPAWMREPLAVNGGVLSHQSAARLHGLGDLVDDRITISAPKRRTSRDPDLWFKTTHLDDDDVTSLDGLPVTTAVRTICDLLDQHVDGSHVAAIIRQAVEANLARLDTLAERIGPYALRYGVRRPGDGEALLEHLLAQIGTTTAQLAQRPAPPRTTAAQGFRNAMQALTGMGSVDITALLGTAGIGAPAGDSTDRIRSAIAGIRVSPKPDTRPLRAIVDGEDEDGGRGATTETENPQ
ncbi:type IV toxin-antitoxin system AbiEi family antitoxin domain-containing protein [Actinokineospora globicatena]|uniref:type IV toxin-antitoxin system AbiEi family antitoxin domain-containing protein n=1 Tax=Actinokineospora globicatena TaxID=103729 RepID=UPI0020A23CC3|nr:type IV toxin-antitoxin system AbiEi family antitoxin domain-containing protein [Actinokineospora globicatena]MCP2301612.1 Transcriptional regulator, predicted component of viral defense system [Actinokineospora globicatena]GLW76734.1 hypothetical protein Aglo01_12160 [Actinokineospora globicatena]GLW83567.1 hypothetical protein Aglo02_12070 [Actinokineospora globicatena]